MSKFNKPRYKPYIRLNQDIREDFKSEKFKKIKWEKFKKRLKNPFNNFFNHHRSQFIKKSHLETSFGNQRLKNNFKENLLTKQRLLSFYNLRNYKLKNLIQNNLKKNKSFIIDLEKRLDIVLFRAKFVQTLFQSRQFICHNKVYVNKKIQSNPNYLIQQGDLVELKIGNHQHHFGTLQKVKKKKKLPIIFFKKKLIYQTSITQLSQKYYKNRTLTFYKHLNKIKKISNFLPNNLEINYKTFSLIFLNTLEMDIKKSFKFWLNITLLSSYYKYN